MRVYGVIGWKNSGKTTLMERLVSEIIARGFSVSTVKHAHHGVDVDQPGRDSYRHRVAGAHEVVLASPARIAVMQELRSAPEPGLEELLGRLQPVDLVLVEGFKNGTHRKIEAHRAATGAVTGAATGAATGKALIASVDDTVRAVASDVALDLSCPVFDLDDITAIADFVLAETGL